MVSHKPLKWGAPLLRQCLLLLTSINFAKGEFICPSDDTIFPCVCQPTTENRGNLYCTDDRIYQETINNLFIAVRESNGLSMSDEINLARFELFEDSITTLDLTPFAKSKIEFMSLTLSPTGTYLVGATNSTDQVDIEPYEFSVGWLYLTKSGCADADVATLLKFVNPAELQFLELWWNEIEGTPNNGSHDGAFFEGLSTFKNLTDLGLDGNIIRRIGGGQFKSNNRLTFISAPRNQINELGENAFFLGQPDDDMLDVQMVINLIQNELHDGGIDEFHGLDSIGRPTVVELQENKFTYISEEKFEKFLRSDPRNELHLQDNIFQCDERMQWLRDGKAEFERRVLNVDCVNDPGKNIFNTDLLS